MQIDNDMVTSIAVMIVLFSVMCATIYCHVMEPRQTSKQKAFQKLVDRNLNHEMLIKLHKAGNEPVPIDLIDDDGKVIKCTAVRGDSKWKSK